MTDPHSSPRSELASLHASPTVRAAAARLVEAVRHEGRNRMLSADAYRSSLAALGEMRGLPMVHPLLAGGAGEGAWVQLADGRRILDMVSGIGPYVFGHDDQDLLETAAVAAAADVAFQGHVLPGLEYYRLSQILLRHAGERLEHVWLSLSGSMANENAWKMILQRHAPADQVLAFEHAFHGRTLAMSELTDRPEYREGLPVRNNVHRIPFYDPIDPLSTQKSVESLQRAIAENPRRIAAMCFELVQGEGGFNDAPATFFRALMGTCREAGIAIWIDEIQTFGRTGELFAFRTLELDDLVDVVTAGKILHGSATLFCEDYRPKPKLVAGTWAGSTVGMAIGARILERLESEGHLGPNGGITRLSEQIDAAFESLEARLPGVVTARSGLGAMQAFVAWDGNAEMTADIVSTCLEEGVLFQTAGSSPMKIRLLPPLCLTKTELETGFASLERALRRVAARFDLAIGSSRVSDD
jgi:4-aminobutyrate aminotransferase-like enzyme